MKHIALRLLLLTLALIFCLGNVACAEQTDDPSDQNTPTDSEQSEPEKEPEIVEILPDVEMKDYNYTLSVMHWTNEGAHEFYNPWNEICPADGVTGQIGDIIEDAVFDRTGWIQENYGITVTNMYQYHSTLPTQVANLIASGSDEYQVLVEFGFDAQRIMGKNYFLDLSVVPNVDFSKPWWIKESVEQLAIGEFVELAASDLLILDKGATSLVFFNLPMADDLGLGNLYELVDDGEWTIEALAECAELAYMDDGNDIRDEHDTFGIVNGDDPVLDLYAGAGMRFIDRDADGEYFFSYGFEEETLDVMSYILDEVMYREFFWNTWLTRDSVTEQPSFKNGDSLFNVSMAKGCNSLRDMEDSYGILPIPKYDEYQESYYSRVNNYHDSLIGVFNTAGDPEAVGAALEVLSYYSYYNIYPQFYEVVIQGRGTRDDDSRRMLDTIFSTRTYDLGLIYGTDGFTDQVLRYTAKGDTNLSSFIATWEKKLDTIMEELNELASTYW